MKQAINHLEIQFQQDPTNSGITSASVACPLLEGLTPIRACQTCEFCGGLEIDPALGKANILCRKASAPRPQPREEPRMQERFSPHSFAARTPVSALMTTKVVCVSADTPLQALAGLLLEKGLSGVPVIDQSERAIGIVSKTDLVRTWYQEGTSKDGAPLPRTVAWEIMNPIVNVLHQDASVAKAAALFASEGLHRVPIVDENGKVVGLLSSTDILRWLALFSGELPEV